MTISQLRRELKDLPDGTEIWMQFGSDPQRFPVDESITKIVAKCEIGKHHHTTGIVLHARLTEVKAAKP